MSSRTQLSQLPAAELLQIPALSPPQGIIPNFAHPDNRGAILVIVNGVLLVLMAPFVAIRAYTKIAIVRKASWDDLTIALAFLGVLALYVLYSWQAIKGPLGKHQWDISLGELANYNYIIPAYISQVISNPTLGATKLTFFILYLQIFRPMRWLRNSVYVGATVTAMIYLAFTVVQTVFSTPRIGQGWVAHFLSPRQAEIARISFPVAPIGLVIDVFLLVLPMVAVYKVQLHTTRKLGLMLMFSTGFIAVMASAVSVYFRYVSLQSKNVTWTFLDLQLMYLVEMQLGIITASMPAFARMLRHHLPPWQELRARLPLRNAKSGMKGTSFSGSTLIGAAKTRFSSGNMSEKDSMRKMEDDGIRLTHDVEHTSLPARSSDGGSGHEEC